MSLQNSPHNKNSLPSPKKGTKAKVRLNPLRKLSSTTRTKSLTAKNPLKITLPKWISASKHLPKPLSECSTPLEIFTLFFEKDKKQNSQVINKNLQNKKEVINSKSFSTCCEWRSASSAKVQNQASKNSEPEEEEEEEKSNNPISIPEYSLEGDESSSCSNSDQEKLNMVEDIVDFIKKDVARSGVTVYFDLASVISEIVECDEPSLRIVMEMFGVGEEEKSLDRYLCFKSFRKFCY